MKGRSPHAGPLDNANMFAEAGLIRHQVDFARIIDDGSGAEVWSVRQDANGRIEPPGMIDLKG